MNAEGVMTISTTDIESLLRGLHVSAESQQWERQYLNGQIARYEAVLDLVEKHHTAGVVVEAGAVPCHLQLALEELGNETVGIDHRPERVDVDVDLRQADLSTDDLPVGDNSVGTVVCSEVLEHLEDPQHALSEFQRVLVDGGALIVTTPNKHRLEARLDMLLGRDPLDWVDERRQAEELGHPGHLQEFSRAELRKLVEDVGLSVVDHRTTNFGRSSVPGVDAIYRSLPSTAPYQVLVARI